MSANTRPNGPARANAWVRHVEAQPSSGPTRPAMPEHYVIEFPDGSVVRAIPKPAGAEPQATPQATPQDAREGGRNSLEEVPGGERTSQGADGASVRSLGDRLRRQAAHERRHGCPMAENLDYLAEKADRLERERDVARGEVRLVRIAHQRDVENLGAANVRLAGELDEARAYAEGESTTRRGLANRLTEVENLLRQARGDLAAQEGIAQELQPNAQVVHTVQTRGGVGDIAGVRIERVQDGVTVTERRLEEARAQVNGLIQEKDQWHDSAKVAEAAVERVRGLAAEWASSPAVGCSSSEQWEFDTLRAAAHDLHEALDGEPEADRG